ncbi:MAG: pilus assembly protein PilM [Candidatus Omnitrophica bacterium]|nr:pilus assembly protein PilM [Candidatus Omnitrophota bacterium]
MMNILGVYFGHKVISIVETIGRKISHYIQIDRSVLGEARLEEKIPDEIKLATIFKEELRRHNMEANQACIALSGRDVIIRNFEMPTLPQDELASAVSFEAKKYIPFKLEEVISDFQAKFDKLTRRNIILFAGIKKEILDKYISIFNQLNIKPKIIEYSAFSILRLLHSAGIATKATVGIIDLDFQQEDEVNFMVLDNGFPLFTRDISLMSELDSTVAKTEKLELKRDLEKLKTEIRVSLDYYDRRFPTKNIEKMFFISASTDRSDLEAVFKDIGMSAHFVDASKLIYYVDRTKPIQFSLNLIKSYSSLIPKSFLKIDLLSAKGRLKPPKEAAIQLELFSFLKDLRLSVWVVILGILICLGAFGLGYFKLKPLKTELDTLLSMRPVIEGVSAEASYEELSEIYNQYKKKIEAVDNLIKKQVFLTDQLDIIPRIIPGGVWLTNFNFKKEESKLELYLIGVAFLSDREKEFRAINKFVTSLKENAKLTKYFKQISVLSIEQITQDNNPATKFEIVCQGR